MHRSHIYPVGVEERYRIDKLLGKGMTAEVFLVWDPHTGKQYAMKVCGDKELLCQESELLKKLDDPAFPKWVDYLEEEVGYLLMEYAEGITLQEWIEQKGKIELKDTIDIMEAILKSLAYLHRMNPPILYRDLKPENILISKSGEIKLIDLGGALVQDEEVCKKTGKTYRVGTYGYAAPEQFWEGVRLGPECDLYAAGKLLAYLLSGKNPCEPPYDILAYCEKDRTVTPAFYKVIQRSLAMDSLGRYASAEEFLRELKGAWQQEKGRKWGFLAKKEKILYEKCIWMSEYQRIF